jgi:hypothetical protein
MFNTPLALFKDRDESVRASVMDPSQAAGSPLPIPATARGGVLGTL